MLTELTSPGADRAHLPTVFEWALRQMDAFDRTFRPRLPHLDAAAWDGDTP